MTKHKSVDQRVATIESNINALAKQMQMVADACVRLDHRLNVAAGVPGVNVKVVQPACEHPVVAQKPTVVRVYRYIRNDLNVTRGRGDAWSFAFDLDYAKQVIRVGWSRCAKEDNFDREIGRAIASKRLEQRPIMISMANMYNTPVTMFVVQAITRMSTPTDRDLLNALSKIEQIQRAASSVAK